MDSLKVAGLMTLVNSIPSVISELWKLFAQELENRNSVEPRDFYGIRLLSRRLGAAWFSVHGRRQDSRVGPPVGAALVVKTIPPRKYARVHPQRPHARVATDLGLYLPHVVASLWPEPFILMGHRILRARFQRRRERRVRKKDLRSRRVALPKWRWIDKAQWAQEKTDGRPLSH